jgi:hypothetical protein
VMRRSGERADADETDIESALAPDRFIGWRNESEFLDELEDVRGWIRGLVDRGDAGRAADLLETFAAGCQAKADEVDDSSGRFGTFAQELLADWIRARQAADADPAETAVRLVHWMETDEYGHVNDVHRWAVEALDRAGLQAFELAVRIRSEEEDAEDWFRHEARRIRKAILARRAKIEAFVALCEETDGLSPRDCETLAGVCERRRRSEEALAWVERGLELERTREWRNRTAWGLSRRRRRLLLELGAVEQAAASAWEEYREHPSPLALEELMRCVPEGDREEWRARALAALETQPPDRQLELLTATGEEERLADVVSRASREELMRPSHDVTEPAAEMLEARHPLAAARLRLALGLRIVEAKKSRYYGAALRHLARGRDLLQEVGRSEVWADLVKEVRARHGAKTSFMPGFERLARGGRFGDGPSFLERARAKWIRRRGDPDGSGETTA